MKSIKFRKKRIILIGFVLFLILLYHETLINQLDKITMPDSSELCKIAPPELCMNFGRFLETFLLIYIFDLI